MRGWRFALVLVAVPLVARSAAAQRSVTVRADNDAFNFWQFPWTRPDEEYTSGVRLILEDAGAPAWARRVPASLGGCADAGRCTSHAWSFGQDIYTAARPHGSERAIPGGRPDAGVLWVASDAATVRDADRIDIGWTAGITGKPSLAESMQHFFHTLAPAYNRPIAWEHELPAEPVVAVRADRRWLRSTGVFEAQPHVGGSLGNLLTEARAGVGLRAGHALAHPWKPAVWSNTPSVAFEGDLSLRAVARNEVLNGTLFRSSPHVTLRPFVGELTGGIRVRWRELEMAWVAHQTSAEYTARRGAHGWSTLEAVWKRR